MTQKVFYSYYYQADCWRASQVRNMGVINGNDPAAANDWETITGAGDASIERWINYQLEGITCTIVLVGEYTAGRKWIGYESKRSWLLGKGLLGINIHNLKNASEVQSQKGKNPFEHFELGDKNMSSIVKLYDPPYHKSTYVYDYIKSNISDWIEDAINARSIYQ